MILVCKISSIRSWDIKVVVSTVIYLTYIFQNFCCFTYFHKSNISLVSSFIQEELVGVYADNHWPQPWLNWNFNKKIQFRTFNHIKFGYVILIFVIDGYNCLLPPIFMAFKQINKTMVLQKNKLRCLNCFMQ